MYILFSFILVLFVCLFVCFMYGVFLFVCLFVCFMYGVFLFVCLFFVLLLFCFVVLFYWGGGVVQSRVRQAIYYKFISQSIDDVSSEWVYA